MAPCAPRRWTIPTSISIPLDSTSTFISSMFPSVSRQMSALPKAGCLAAGKELCFSYVKIDFLITELDGKALVACIGFHSQDFCVEM